MKLKVVEVGGVQYAVVQDGKPVYEHDGGKEVAFNAPEAVETIKRVSDERDAARTDLGKAQTALKPFEGLDPEKARTAVQTVANLDSKKLIDAGEVERVRTEVASGYETKIKDLETSTAKTLADKDAEIWSLTIGRDFSTSPVINGDTSKLAVSALTAEDVLKKHFVLESGKPVAYYDPETKKQPVMSLEKPGYHAPFGEAVLLLVDRRADKDKWLKGTGATGSGQVGGNTTNTANASNENRSSIDLLSAGLK